MDGRCHSVQLSDFTTSKGCKRLRFLAADERLDPLLIRLLHPLITSTHVLQASRNLQRGEVKRSQKVQWQPRCP